METINTKTDNNKKLSKEQLIRFNNWVYDGNVVRVGRNIFKEQSTQWSKEFTYDELIEFFIKEYGEG